MLLHEHRSSRAGDDHAKARASAGVMHGARYRCLGPGIQPPDLMVARDTIWPRLSDVYISPRRHRGAAGIVRAAKLRVA
jgi:hypothetical protein